LAELPVQIELEALDERPMFDVEFGVCFLVIDEHGPRREELE
jgi:hypothetical protein